MHKGMASRVTAWAVGTWAVSVGFGCGLAPSQQAEFDPVTSMWDIRQKAIDWQQGRESMPDARALASAEVEVDELLSRTDAPHMRDILERTRVRLWLAAAAEDGDVLSRIQQSITARGPSAGKAWSRRLDIALLWADELEASGHPKLSTTLLESILSIYHANQQFLDAEQTYMLLKRAYLRGQLTFVLAAMNQNMPSGPETKDAPQLLRLYARAVTAEFQALSRKVGRPSRLEDADELRRLAQECTRAYEACLDAASTDYERIQIANEYCGLVAHRRFDSDSRLLRRYAVPPGPSPEDRQATQAHRLAEFKEAVLGGLETGPVTNSN